MIATADSSKPFKFILGANTVIQGFEKAVAYLNLQSKATVHIRSDLAYGKRGQPPDIGNDEDLVIVLEVLASEAAGIQSTKIMNDE